MDSLLSRLKNEFYIQKEKIHLLVRQEIENYEKCLTSKIKNDKNRGKQIYKHIKRLQNRDKMVTKKPISIYNEDNSEIEKHDLKNQIYKCWKPIYNQHENKIVTEWGDSEKSVYNDQYNNEKLCTGKYKSSISIERGNIKYNYDFIHIPDSMREHDYGFSIENRYSRMNEPVISNEDIKTQIRKIKSGKAPGPDNIKPELYKYLIDNENIVQNMKNILNNIIETGDIPEDWKSSITILF